MQFTYRNPARSTDPGAAVAGRPPSSSVRAVIVRTEPAADRRPDRTAAIARYAWVDHYEPPRRRCACCGADGCAPPGCRAVVLADDNASSTARPPTAPVSAGTARTPICLLPGQGSWFVLGSVVTDAPLPRARPAAVEDGCGACRRCLPAAPPAPSSPRVWSTPVAAWRGWCRRPGHVSRRVPGGPGRPHLRLRRLPGGVPAVNRPRATQRRRRPPDAEAGGRTEPSICSSCWPPPTPSCSRATVVGTSPSASPATCGATRSSPWATSATAATRRSPRPCGGRLPTTIRWSAPTRCGRRPGSAATTCSAGPGDRSPEVRAELAALGQVAAAHRPRRGPLPRAGTTTATAPRPRRPSTRAPTTARRRPTRDSVDPRRSIPRRPGGRPSCATCLSPTTSRPRSAASSRTCGSCGGGCRPTTCVVLTTPYAGAEAWDRQQPFRVVRAREPVLLPSPSLRRRIDRLAAETGAELVVLDPALPLGLVGPACAIPMRSSSTAPRSPCPGGCPAAAAARAGAARRPARGAPPAATRRRRRRAPPGRSLPTVMVPPGVDTERFRPLTPTTGAAARAHFGLPADGRWWSRSAAWCPARGSTRLIARRRSPGRESRPI